MPVSILLFTFSIFMVVGGLFEKKFGSRITAFGGGVLVCLGWILSYAASSMEWLYVTYGLLVGMGTGLCYLASISTAIKWFPDKKGFASGVVVFGFGFGSAFLAPLAVRLIEGYGWRITMLIYGIAFGMIIMSASRLLKTPPQNWNPEGAMPEKKLANTNIFTDFSPAEMVATGAFKVIFLTYFFAMV
ncbi:MFS transporter, partial [Caldithrix abyssi]